MIKKLIILFFYFFTLFNYSKVIKFINHNFLILNLIYFVNISLILILYFYKKTNEKVVKKIAE